MIPKSRVIHNTWNTLLILGAVAFVLGLPLAILFSK